MISSEHISRTNSTKSLKKYKFADLLILLLSKRSWAEPIYSAISRLSEASIGGAGRRGRRCKWSPNFQFANLHHTFCQQRNYKCSNKAVHKYGYKKYIWPNRKEQRLWNTYLLKRKLNEIVRTKQPNVIFFCPVGLFFFMLCILFETWTEKAKKKRKIKLKRTKQPNWIFFLPSWPIPPGL